MKIVFKAITLITVPLVFNIVLVGALSICLRQADELNLLRWRDVTTLESCGDLTTNIHVASAAARLADLTRDPSFEQVHNAALESAKRQSSELHVKFTADEQAINRTLRQKYKTLFDNTSFNYTALDKDMRLEWPARRPMMAGLTINIILTGLITLFLYNNIAARLTRLTHGILNYKKLRIKPEILSGNDELNEVDRELQNMVRTVEEAGKHERAILENVGDVIVSIKLDGTFTHCNKQATALWLAEPGKILYDLVEPDSQEELSSFLTQCEINGNSLELVTGIKAIDTTVPFRIKASWSPADQVIFITARDIRQELLREESKRHVLATIGHDLKAPLTSIRLSLAGVAEGLYGPISQHGIQSLNQADAIIGVLLKSLRELLDFEKMESGKLTLELEEYSIQDILLDAIEGSPDMSESLTVANLPDVSIACDVSRLADAFAAMLAAARRLSIGDLSLRTKRTADTIDILFSFKTDREDLSFLFDRYTSGAIDEVLDSSARLTLPLARAIVRAHGGELEATVEPGTGNLQISLPLNGTEISSHGLVTTRKYADRHRPELEANNMNAVTTHPQSFFAKQINEMFESSSKTGLLSTVTWWEGRRLFYNMSLFVAGMPGVILYFSRGHQNYIAVGLGIILWAISANLCYTLGPILEIGARNLRLPITSSFGPSLLKLGWLFSIALTAIEALMAAIALV